MNLKKICEKVGDFLGKSSNIFLLFGDEKYDLEKRVKVIKKEFDNLEVGVNLFYITKDNIEQLKDILSEVTFFGTHKLVIIKDTNLKFDIELLNNIDQDIKVIIIEDSVDKRTANYKNLSKIGIVEEFKMLDRRAMTTNVYDLIKKYNIDISFNVADYFVEVCGLNKNNNINEIRKIVIYMDSKGKLTKEIIDKICIKTLNAKIFDVLNNIVNKNTKVGIEMLDDLLKQKESIIKIYIMLYKQVKQ